MTTPAADPDGAPAEAASSVRFAVFSAANEAAIHLLETIQCKSSPPALESDEHEIGYRLSIKLPCSEARPEDLKWHIGAGPSPAMIEQRLCRQRQPDILLCPPGRTPSSAAVRRFIKDMHAMIYFHPQSGVLLFKAISGRPIIYEQGDVDDEDLVLDMMTYRRTFVLRRKRNYLRFGEYRFALEISATDDDRERLAAILDKNLYCCYHGSQPSQLLNFLPTEHSEVSWNVWLHRRIPDTTITSGVHILTGQPVAVKELQVNSRTRRHILDRLRFACEYSGKSDQGVLGIFDAWCGHNTSPPCHFSENESQSESDSESETFDDCHQLFYSTPLAKYTFLNAPWAEIQPKTRLLFFYQTLVGLAELHRRGLTHGNIEPGSLFVLPSIQPSPTVDRSVPKRAVLSLCMKQTATLSPRIYVAPEIWSHTSVDRVKADIWALGASWLPAFFQLPSGVKVTKDSYNKLQKNIDAHTKKRLINAHFAALLRKMLAWEPSDRPGAEELLADVLWQPVLARARSIEASKKRKRMERIHQSFTRPRRVRLLSPDHT
ncbi:kinase-like domain-containing protein [Trichoderma gracile]